MKKNDQNFKLLYKAVLSLKDDKECEMFLKDLCTVQELDAMAQRFAVAGMLFEGSVYNAIVEKTSASTATISRVNRTLNYGEGGYKLAFERIKDKK